MRNYFLGCFAFLLLHIASSSAALLTVKTDVDDQAKLQRGAKIFMNYCSGCHSLKYLRYNRMGKDLGLIRFDGQLDVNLLVNNLIFTHAKVQDPIRISMPTVDARQWFGLVPPDLSLSARERGAAWIYTYLKSFYSDNKRPFGANNLLVMDTAMPNILAPLAGELNEQQFNEMLEDLISFLVYVSEPAKLVRYQIGIKVVGFLFFFLIVAYWLKKSYWKNLH